MCEIVGGVLGGRPRGHLGDTSTCLQMSADLHVFMLHAVVAAVAVAADGIGSFCS